MIALQRYEPAMIYSEPDMRPAEDGDYVRYSDVAPLLAVIEHRFEHEILRSRPPVMMCGCEDFMTCEHPYPQIVHVP